MPKLPATTMVEGCYAYMFEHCYSLTKTTPLASTSLAPRCYRYMFGACTGLTFEGFTLPASELAEECYFGMFDACLSLTAAPELNAAILQPGCYASMFIECYNLKYIQCLATDISATDCTKRWTSGVPASGGNFVKIKTTNWPTNTTTTFDGIPRNWTVLNYRDIGN